MQIHSPLLSRRPLIAPEDVSWLFLASADLRILIVNEDMHSADSLKRTLHELGYPTTLTAYSAKRALVAVADSAPSVLLLDLEPRTALITCLMGGMDAMERIGKRAKKVPRRHC